MKYLKQILILLMLMIGLIPVYLTYPLWAAYLKQIFVFETMDINKLAICTSPQKTTIRINTGSRLIVVHDLYNKVEKITGIEKSSHQINCQNEVRIITIKGDSMIIKTTRDYIDTTPNNGLIFSKSGQLSLGQSLEVSLFIDEDGFFKQRDI